MFWAGDNFVTPIKTVTKMMPSAPRPTPIIQHIANGAPGAVPVCGVQPTGVTIIGGSG